VNSTTHKFMQFVTKSPLGMLEFLQTNTSDGLGVIFVGSCCVHQPRTGRVHCVNNSSPPPGHCRIDGVLYRICEQIQMYQIPLTNDDFLRFLWEGEQVDLQDMNNNFLHEELLIKVCILFMSNPRLT